VGFFSANFPGIFEIFGYCSLKHFGYFCPFIQNGLNLLLFHCFFTQNFHSQIRPLPPNSPPPSFWQIVLSFSDLYSCCLGASFFLSSSFSNIQKWPQKCNPGNWLERQSAKVAAAKFQKWLNLIGEKQQKLAKIDVS
jgi:hypothetical protein